MSPSAWPEGRVPFGHDQDPYVERLAPRLLGDGIADEAETEPKTNGWYTVRGLRLSKVVTLGSSIAKNT